MCRDGLDSPFECQFSIIQARSENMGGAGGAFIQTSEVL